MSELFRKIRIWAKINLFGKTECLNIAFMVVPGYSPQDDLARVRIYANKNRAPLSAMIFRVKHTTGVWCYRISWFQDRKGCHAPAELSMLEDVRSMTLEEFIMGVNFQ